MTPGREDMIPEEAEAMYEELGTAQIAREYIEALGGNGNIVEVEACITRLRLTLKDSSLINEARLKALGAAGVIKVSSQNAQVVVGTRAENMAEEIKKCLRMIA